MSFYEKWTTAREDFWQWIERRVPSLPSCCRAGGNTEYYLHTEFRSQHMPHLFIEVLNRSPPFLIWQSTLIHCFISDDANGIVKGRFSERGEWLYYSSVLCSDFLCSCKTGPLYNPPLVINLSSFFILKADWNSKESVYSGPYKISQARAFKVTVLAVIFWRGATVSCGAVLFLRDLVVNKWSQLSVTGSSKASRNESDRWLPTAGTV